MPDPFQKPSLIAKAGSFLKVLFLAKFPMNLLAMVAVVGISLFFYNFAVMPPAVAGNAVLESPFIGDAPSACIESCNECPPKKEVERFEVEKFQCADGRVEESLNDCRIEFPDFEKRYSSTANDITLSIDGISFEKDSEDRGVITRIDYTIINEGESPVVPKLAIKVYPEWSSKVKKADPNKVIDLQSVISPQGFAQRQDRARIAFTGNRQTVRIDLINVLPEPDADVLTVTREFDLS
ncbi:hypothetical protein HYU14_03775 [Candidatus Woesearchaeota archaeon]|nr:hypothetical protein [Candidatus Woesearchaeota archaeon]